MENEHADLTAGIHVRHPLSSTESTLLSSLASNGKNIFTLEDITRTLQTTYENAKVIANRLVKKVWLIRLTPGKYLIIPLEAGTESRYSEHGFVIAHHLVKPYYIGYLSALNYHGLSDRVSPVIYIVTTKRRRDRTILHTRLRFITVKETKMFGWEKTIISNTAIQISDPEKTVVDCLDRPEYGGGLDEIAKTIFYEHGSLNMPKLLSYAEKNGNKTVIKRLGYLLDHLKLTEYQPLFKEIKLSQGYPKLDPMHPPNGTYNRKWGLLVNTVLTPEA